MPLLVYPTSDFTAFTKIKSAEVNGKYNAIKTLLNVTALDDTNIQNAGITRATKLKAGTANYVLINNGSGAMSEEVTLSPVRGGTGVANNAAATLTRSGNHAVTLTTTGVTGVTLPTTGTLATLDGVETLTNKTITSPVIATITNGGTVTLPSTGTLATLAGSETLTNKTLTAPVIATISNGGTVTLPTTGTLATLAGSETLTNKTLTAPVISTITNTGTVTLPTGGTLATLAGSETFTNKTLTAPVIATITNVGTVTLPTAGTLATLAGLETLTNKSISGSSNTLTNVSLTTAVTGTLPVANGGTNVTSYTTGDLLYATGSTTLSKLGIGSAGQFLKSTGTAPQWSAVAQTFSVVSKTANYTLTTSDDMVLGSTAGGAFTLTLPAASSASGKVFTIKKTNSDVTALSVTRAGSDTVDGLATIKLFNQYETLQIASDGSATWQVVARASSTLSINASNTAGTSLSNSFSSVPFATVAYDTHGAWVTDTFTVPTDKAGKYRITAAIYMSPVTLTTTQDTILGIAVNGTIKAQQIATGTGGISDTYTVLISADYSLAAGDTVIIKGYSDANNTLNTGAGRNYVNIMQIV